MLAYHCARCTPKLNSGAMHYFGLSRSTVPEFNTSVGCSDAWLNPPAFTCTHTIQTLLALYVTK
jgi:hypothetical protein